MDGVGTPIIGRPRPLPGHDTPNPAYHPHTLNYEEPVNVPATLIDLSSLPPLAALLSLEVQQLFDYGNYPVFGVGWGLVVGSGFNARVGVGDGVGVGCLAHHFQVI